MCIYFLNSLLIYCEKPKPQAQNMSIYRANTSAKTLQKNNLQNDDLLDYKYLGLSLRCIKTYILNKLSLTEKFVLPTLHDAPNNMVAADVDMVGSHTQDLCNNKLVDIVYEEPEPKMLLTTHNPHPHPYFTRSKVKTTKTK